MREKIDVEEFRWRMVRPKPPRWPWAVLALSAMLLVASVLHTGQAARTIAEDDAPAGSEAAFDVAEPPPQPVASPVKPVLRQSEPSRVVPVVPAVRQAVRVPTDTPAVEETDRAAPPVEAPEPRVEPTQQHHRKPPRTRHSVETRLSRSYERPRTSYGHMPPWATSAFGLGFGRW